MFKIIMYAYFLPVKSISTILFVVSRSSSLQIAVMECKWVDA